MLTARLRPGSREHALELAAAMPDQSASGFERLSIYLSQRQVIFLIEGARRESLVRKLFNDSVRSTEVGPWLPLFDGPLHRADEVYHWSSGG